MAIPSIATMPLSPSSPAEMSAVQSVLVRDTERSLFDDSAVVLPSVDRVDFSDTGLLLSSIAELSEAASAAESGSPPDPQAIIDDAQRFVDSFNGLTLEAAFEPGGVLELAPGVAPSSLLAPSLTQPPGIELIPLGSEEGPVLLTLDSETLESALASDPAGTTSQLAAFALPLGAELATQTVQAGLLSNPLGATESDLIVAASGSVLTAQAELTSAARDDVVPDLVEVNAELRRALADTALTEVLADIGLETSNDAALATPVSPALEDETLAAVPAGLPDVQDGPDEPVPATTSQTSASAPGSAPPQSVSANMVVAVEAIPQTPSTALSAADLLTTPLEQITRLATNPTVAGAVAAFQITGDEGGRAARVGITSDFELVNPTAAVLQTGAIAADLANTRGQRRENGTDPRESPWLTTRPGFI